MAYLVTGGTGYLGSYTVRDLLTAGKDVVCLQRSVATPLFRDVVGEDNVEKVKIIQGDVSNLVQLLNVIREHNISHIIHMGYLMPPHSETDPAHALQVNTVGTNNILEAGRLFDLKRVVWCSSTRAFGHIGEIWDKPLDGENAVYMPNTMYGACKVLNEFMTRLYYERFGVDAICMRLGRTFGTGRMRGAVAAFAEFLRKAATNLPAKIGEGDVVTGYMYVEDFSDLAVKICDVPTPRSRIYNAVDAQCSHRDIAKILKKINPQAQITVVSGVDDRPIFGGFRPPKLDASALRAELDWQPKYGMEGGLRKILNYYRHQEGMPLLV